MKNMKGNKQTKEIIINRKFKMAVIGPNMAVIMANVKVREFYSLVNKRYSYISKIPTKFENEERGAEKVIFYKANKNEVENH